MNASEFECEASVEDLTQSVPLEAIAGLAELCCFALDQERLTGHWSVTIALTTDEHMIELHGAFMNDPETTDIMTFPFNDERGGDIAISAAQAELQRHDDAWELADELRFLVVHGALHLAGWDDATPADRLTMLERQREIIAEFQDGPSSNR